MSCGGDEDGIVEADPCDQADDGAGNVSGVAAEEEIEGPGGPGGGRFP